MRIAVGGLVAYAASHTVTRVVCHGRSAAATAVAASVCCHSATTSAVVGNAVTGVGVGASR